MSSAKAHLRWSAKRVKIAEAARDGAAPAEAPRRTRKSGDEARPIEDATAETAKGSELRGRAASTTTTMTTECLPAEPRRRTRKRLQTRKRTTNRARAGRFPNNGPNIAYLGCA
jgi:hypothetical protein